MFSTVDSTVVPTGLHIRSPTSWRRSQRLRRLRILVAYLPRRAYFHQPQEHARRNPHHGSDYESRSFGFNRIGIPMGPQYTPQVSPLHHCAVPCRVVARRARHCGGAPQTSVVTVAPSFHGVNVLISSHSIFERQHRFIGW